MASEWDVCSTATTVVKLGRRATRRVWAGHRARPRRVRRVSAITGGRPSLAPVRRGATGRRDSRVLHGEEMSEDRSRPPSTARLRRRISATIFYFFVLKINVIFLSMYIHLSIHLL